MAREYRIEVIKGSDEGSKYKLTGVSVVFGRSKDADIVVMEKAASRRHAELRFQESGYLIRDLNSINGVYVNGRKVDEQFLKPGDVFSICGTSYRYIILEEDSIELNKQKNIRNETIPGVSLTKVGKVPIPMARKGVTNKKRFIIYGGVLGIIFLFFIMASDTDDKENKKDKTKKEDEIIVNKEEVEDMEPDYGMKIEKGMEGFFKKADSYYFLGRREYLLKNYTRALDEFRKALTFYPNHGKARYYARICQKKIKEESLKLLDIGKKYYEQLRFDLAIRFFNDVIYLNSKKTNSDLVKEAKKWKKKAEKAKGKIKTR
jgi:pSer/pThr/pTyr-binding forkhead associated (FHA) protein